MRILSAGLSLVKERVKGRRQKDKGRRQKDKSRR
jgi:hypothetical protein